MATVSGSGPVTDARSGGKIVTKKRSRTTTTPYDRPPPPQQPQGSPNWFTGVIFPATRMIASGAVKIISSVFDSSSSSSSSSSDGEADTDDDVINDNHYDNSDGVNRPNKEHVISSEARKFVNKEPQLSLHKSITKSAIERLLMQESFSRQERDRFMQIINSRVIDHIVGGEADVVFADTPVGIISHDTGDLCNEAVLEARKWLEEKKVGSSPLSDLAHESHGLNTVAPQHIENETGSPVDVAKLYMRSRPPWASPLAEHNELQTPFALTRELFREGTSASFAGDSFSSSKKRNSLASGSWNIEEELRRVRSKASEDLLSSLPSTNLGLSTFGAAPKSGEDSLKTDSLVGRGVEGNKSNLMTETQPVDASRDVAAGLSSSVQNSAVEMKRDALENHTSVSHQAPLLSEEYQDIEAVKITSECAGSKSNHSAHLDIGTEPCDDPRLSQGKVPHVEDVRESEGTENVNARSLSTELGTREIHGQPDEGNSTAAKSVVKTTNSIQVEDTCELLSEASVEVPIVDETNGIADISQIFSSVHHEELSFVPTQPNTDKLVGSKDDGEALKQEAKKPGRFNRKGRGRGK